MTPTFCTRLVLMEVPNPDTIDIKKLTALVRAKYVQEGGKESDVTTSTVRQARCNMRSKFKDRKLTHERVRKCHQDALAFVRKPIPAAHMYGSGNGTHKPISTPPPTALATSVLAELITDVKAITMRCGGYAQLREILNALEGGNP